MKSNKKDGTKSGPLIIVESYSKGLTISKYLNMNAIASSGHIKKILSKSNQVLYSEKTGDVIPELKIKWSLDRQKADNILNAAKVATEIYVATDMDREGEAIASHIYELLTNNNITCPIWRVFSYEITKQAMQEALKNKRNVDQNLVNAFITRVVLDYKVGFGISPWLCKILYTSASAGRVQSPALKMIVELEKKIHNFVKQKYYTISGNFYINSNKVECNLVQYHETKFSTYVTDLNLINTIKDDISKIDTFEISNITKKTIKYKPAPPLSTSTLQQKASELLNFSISSTMQIAQKLYEGIDLDNQRTGLITYMRTDSINISSSAVDSIREYININYPIYLPDKPNKFENKIKNAQEAHECIRPTNILLEPDHIKQYVSDDEYALYKLIWKHTIATQMNECINEVTTYKLIHGNIVFTATYTVNKHRGYKIMVLNNDVLDIEVPILNKGDKYHIDNIKINEHETAPPHRYSDADLVKELEKCGVGRPATFATIVKTLLEREYVIKRGKVLVPTLKGEIVSILLDRYFNRYCNKDFTAEMENKLDIISNGRDKYETILYNFIQQLETDIQSVDNKSNNISDFLLNIQDELTLIDTQKTCTICNGPLQVRIKYSIYLRCEKCNKNYSLAQQYNISDDLVVRDYNTYIAIYKGEKKVYVSKKIATNLDQDNIQFLLNFPGELGTYKDEMIYKVIGRITLSLKYKDKYYSLKYNEAKDLTLDSAIQIINSKV